jgi:hypothetical protein
MREISATAVIFSTVTATSEGNSCSSSRIFCKLQFQRAAYRAANAAKSARFSQDPALHEDRSSSNKSFG